MSWACWWKRHCVCVDSGGVVMWFESQSRIAHMCWSPQRGRRWTKHPFIAAVTAVRREKLFTRGFMLFTTLSSLTLSGPSAPSSSCPAFTRLIPDHLSLSLSLQERVSNITTGYHWYGARHWDDQTLWTRQQICQQHQQAAGCSRGERGETEKKEIILHRFYLYFIPV